MNKYLAKALSTSHGRRPVFETIIRDYLAKLPNPSILEIGCSRDLDENSISGDGYSSLYWANFLLTHPGSLTIVDISDDAIAKCKIIMSDFVGKIDLTFVVDDGMNWVCKPYDFYYLDGGNSEWQTFEMFRKINLANGAVLLDDWNPGGKCDSIKTFFPFGLTIHVNHIHQMGWFNKIPNDSNKNSNIGNLESAFFSENRYVLRKIEAAQAFDELSILEIKKFKSTDQKQKESLEKQMCILSKEIGQSIGFGLAEKIYCSEFYANLLNVNHAIFMSVDDFKESTPVKLNLERINAKRRLQENFFGKTLEEIKM